MNDELEQEELSLRDTLEQQYDDAEGHDSEESVEHEEVASNSGRVRDERGRFAKADGSEAGEEPIGHDGEGEPEAESALHTEGEPAPDDGEHAGEPVEEALRAPQSWKPAAREHWNALPPEVQEEVYRREHGMQQYLNQTAEERKTAQAFHEVYAPYEAMIRGEGADPLTATGHLFQTAYMLRTAPPQQKAALVADMIRTYGVNIEALDAALVGRAPPQGAQQQPQQPMTDPRVDNILEALQNVQQQSEEQRTAQAHAELSDFAQKHEFLDDVRDMMADLMEVASNRGVHLSLEEAYNQACMATPDVATVINRRQKAEAAKSQQQRMQGARNAASSVGGAPTRAPGPDPDSMNMRDAILSAIETTGG